MLLMDWETMLGIALLAYVLDKSFGEFQWIRHPVIMMGDFIKAYEKRFYRSTLSAGLVLTVLLVSLSALIGWGIMQLLSELPNWLNFVLSALIASMLLAHRMLYDSVAALLSSDQPQQAVRYLVSRDTEQMTHSDAYQAGIETYAENLSDGVMAPLFYLLLFGLPGILAYKAINTLDSMIGYRTDRYEQFGKFAARLDDLANWFPARITAILILLLRKVPLPHWRQVWQQAKGHASPNAGYPITAMAFACQLQLGGPTHYFGQLKDKPYFGPQNGIKTMTSTHLTCSLKSRHQLDAVILISLAFPLLCLSQC